MVAFADANDPSTTATFTQVGSYVLGLTATDGEFMAFDDTTVTVTDPVLVGAGDIAADCTTGASTANAEETAKLLDGIPGAVFTLGDNAYQDGTAAQFAKCYGPAWGRHIDRTRPITGNHDYNTANATPYFDYFNGQAGDRSGGYYSYDVGNWHIVVLNSECTTLWDTNGCVVGSPQEQWLRADLAASPTNNIIAMWHRPLYSSGGSFATHAYLQPLWQALYDYGVDIMLAGHWHNYERLAPVNATGQSDATYGIRTFVIGTGGVGFAGYGTILPTSEVRNNTTFGVMKFTLHDTTYDWQFIPIAGQTFTDSGTAAVHGPPPPNTAPTANPQNVSTNEDTPLGITLTGSDPQGSPLTFAPTTPLHGTLTGTGAARTYTPAANYFGPDSFTFTVNDGSLTSAPATVSIDVVAVNDPPAANGQSVQTTQDAAVEITLTGSDPEGAALVFTTGTPLHGTLSGTGATPTYTPAANYAGPDSFTFTVSDGSLTSAPATVAITVNPIGMPVNNAIDFGGTNAYVTFGPAPGLGVSTMTIEAWFRRDGAGAATSTGTGGITAIPIVSKGMAEDEVTTRNMNFFLGINSANSVLAADFEDNATGLNHPVLGVTPVPANGVWHHAAATYDGTTWRLYLDGVLETTVLVSGTGGPFTPRFDSIQHAAIGSALNSTGGVGTNPQGFFNGAIDEVRVWNRALSHAEIKTNINQQIISAANLAARWGLNEGGGTTINDSTADPVGGNLVGTNYVWTAGAPFNLDVSNTDPILVGAGDIAADCTAGASTVNAQATATLLDGITGTVFTLGDNSYVDGTAAQFANCYGPTWGRHEPRTRPTTGNHDYHSAGASPYYDFFNSAGVQVGAAGDRIGGYYSYNLGNWHVVVLNSECTTDGVSSWDLNGCGVGSPQEQWLRADLAASPTNNIIAMWHRPLYSSSSSAATHAFLQPLWKALYDGGTDIWLGGHWHNYERLAPMNATGAADPTYGIRSFVVGTGGVGTSGFGTILPTSEVRGTPFGVMKFTLHENSYDWQFIPIVGQTFTDSGTGIPHGPPPNGAPTANPQNLSTNEDVPLAVTLTGSDPENGPLTFTTGVPVNGTLTGTGAARTFTPTPNYFGPASFTFTVNDGTSTSAPATVSITVNPVNDPPTANAQNLSTNEDVPLAVTLTGSDPEGSALTFTTGAPVNGTLTGTGAARTFTPTPNYSGPASFTFTVNDGSLTSAPATVSITVNPVNDPPTANPQSLVTTQNTPLNVTLTGSDPEGSALTFTTGAAVNGTLTGTGAARTFTPTANYVGPASFTFTVSDGSLTSAPATVNITVNPVGFTPFTFRGVGGHFPTVDNANQGTGPGPVVLTPPASMQVGDLYVIVASYRGTATLTLAATGGQTWTSEANTQANGQTLRVFWCRFNGTWAGNPSVTNTTGAETLTAYSAAFAVAAGNQPAIDVAFASGAHTGGTATVPTFNTLTAGALALAGWVSGDNNVWSGLTAGWSSPGNQAQWRNIAATDNSIALAYRLLPTAGATGAIAMTQSTEGPDNGIYFRLAFRAAPSAPPSQVPADPTNLQQTTSVGQVLLNWTDNANNEDGFTIERCTGAGCSNFAPLPGVGPNVTMYADTSVAPLTTYRFRVRAFNALGPSNYTNVVDATTPATPPPPPSPFTFRAVGTHFPTTDNTNQGTGPGPVAVTPPASMQLGDLYVIVATYRGTATLSLAATGGQTWTSEANAQANGQTVRVFWTRFNGTWAGNPTVTNTTGAETLTAYSFAMSLASGRHPEIDVAFASAAHAGGTVTVPAFTTNTAGALALVGWISGDNNTWSAAPAGWSSPGGQASWRNIAATDNSISLAYQVFAAAGTTGPIARTQATEGPTNGLYFTIAWKQVQD
jgi:hypothetical protein